MNGCAGNKIKRNGDSYSSRYVQNKKGERQRHHYHQFRRPYEHYKKKGSRRSMKILDKESRVRTRTGTRSKRRGKNGESCKKIKRVYISRQRHSTIRTATSRAPKSGTPTTPGVHTTPLMPNFSQTSWAFSCVHQRPRSPAPGVPARTSAPFLSRSCPQSSFFGWQAMY